MSDSKFFKNTPYQDYSSYECDFMPAKLAKKMVVPFWDPTIDYMDNRKEYMTVIDSVLRQGDLILRQDLEIFEIKFADKVGTKYAVGVASGTDALILTMKALGIGEGDEVIVPSYTFRATIEAVHHVGATPVLADLGEDWRPYRTKKTKAIIPAHIAGEVLFWTLEEFETDILMIEDSCQAITAKPLTGIAAAYSFYPAKILGCFGDGGAIATNDEALYEELLKMRNHYKGDWSKFGYNSRLDNVQAAVLNTKIDYLDKMLQRRLKIAQRYDEELKGVVTPNKREVYQDYIIECFDEEERDQLQRFLEIKGIGSMANGYPFPKAVPKKKKAFEYESRSLRIPCNPDLTDEQVTYVIKRINEFYN